MEKIANIKRFNAARDKFEAVKVKQALLNEILKVYMMFSDTSKRVYPRVALSQEEALELTKIYFNQRKRRPREKVEKEVGKKEKD